MFALIATAAKKLSEMSAVAGNAPWTKGTSAVEVSRMAPTAHARSRAEYRPTPRLAQFSDNQPPASPPSEAKTGGTHANRRLATAGSSPCAETRNTVVQFVHRL